MDGKLFSENVKYLRLFVLKITKYQKSFEEKLLF